MQRRRKVYVNHMEVSILSECDRINSSHSTRTGGRRCNFVGCPRTAQNKGFCRGHGGGKLCAVFSCRRHRQVGALCPYHYALKEVRFNNEPCPEPLKASASSSSVLVACDILTAMKEP